MFCKKCGKELRPGENFCTQCGTPAFDEYRKEAPHPDKKVVKKEAPYPDKKVVKQKRDNEWKKEEKKEKTILIILSVLIVFLVVAIVAGIISLFATDNTEQPDTQKNEIRTEVMEDVTEDDREDEKKIQEEESVRKQDSVGTTEPENEKNTPSPERPQQTAEPSVSVPQQQVTQPQAPADPVITAPVQQNDQFIISDSNTRYITNADLNGLNEWEIRIARNEIYARRGRIFKSDDLQRYFNSKDWYHPSVSPEQFDNSYLNNIEIENLKVILNYEKAHNLNQ